ncbi:putative G-protein coupled receptor 83-like protein [Leptotrombidium deliense]|uniref:Putative G-protein coupled receptor 83-like protein n=1 Tax=Leptotrombidium deliense TaxID=299467 RepID=A0A443SI82_9ACAR|nr:putative G-protein coupled receptor 83-like protein [Leptotrombidium deliense]
MNVSNAKDEHLEVGRAYNPVRDVILLFLYSCTALFAIIANTLLCKIVMNNKRMQTKTNLLIVSMAVSDILAGIAIPGQWLFCSHALLFSTAGQILCGIFKSLQIVTYFLSTLTMVTIAIHRYLGIFHRSEVGIVRIRFHVKAAVISTWVIAVVFVAMTAVSIKIFQYFTPKEIITCGVILEFTEPFDSKVVRKTRVASVLLGQFLVPLLITALLYARIGFVVFRRQIIGESSETRSKRLSESKKKTILMLIVVLVVFTICWLPVHTHHFVNFFWKPKKKLKGYCNNTTSYFIMYWLSISSCCYNPIIYYIFDDRFRSAFQNIFRITTQRMRKTTPSVKLSDTAPSHKSESSKPSETSESNV